MFKDLFSDGRWRRVAERTYIAIDLKSFYASVEAISRGLDPLTTNLVVADESRTEKTICLAVSPSLKACGLPGRPRLFEVIERVREINAGRRRLAPGGKFTGTSWDADKLRESPELALDYITALPRMALYMSYSTRIYHIYLRYIAPEDIHVYSIDEVFMDVTAYLDTYGMTARQLAMTIIREVLAETGITATVGIGSNLYLCKVAMDIVAKHQEPDKDGVRIAWLDEKSYRRQLWNHIPLTDFWRVGPGYAKRLAAVGLYTMGDVARCAMGAPGDFYNEDLLYKLFGVNAELLIDHAWGWEPCTMADIKAYQPEYNSLGSGQVLQRPYSCREARLIVREMTDSLVLDLVEKRLVTDQVVLTIGYDIENLRDKGIRQVYQGEITRDHYGRCRPKSAHGSANLKQTSSAKRIIETMLRLYDRIIDEKLLVRRVTISFSHVVSETWAAQAENFQQLDLFTDYEAQEEKRRAEAAALDKERRIQEAILHIRKRYGKNAILKGTSLEEASMTRERNNQIGGHRA